VNWEKSWELLGVAGRGFEISENFLKEAMWVFWGSGPEASTRPG
jgi:hypothetical protein